MTDFLSEPMVILSPCSKSLMYGWSFWSSHRGWREIRLEVHDGNIDGKAILYMSYVGIANSMAEDIHEGANMGSSQADEMQCYPHKFPIPKQSRSDPSENITLWTLTLRYKCKLFLLVYFIELLY